MAKKISIPSHYEPLWKLAHYFSRHNSQITSQMVAYFKERFLDEVFELPFGNGTKTYPVFIDERTIPSLRSVYYDTRAKDIFIARHKEELRQKADEFFKTSEFIPLRLFTRQLLQRPELFERKLKTFILENCLNDTFNTTNELGQEITLPIFEVPQNFTLKSPISVRQKGLIPFIQQHQEDLQQMGVVLSDVLLEKYRPTPDLLYQSEVADALYIENKRQSAKLKLYQLMGTKASAIMIKEGDKTRPLISTLLHNGKKTFCLLKKDLPYFTSLFQDDLRKIGVTNATIRCYTEGEELTPLTDDIIPITHFLRHHLKTTTASGISEAIHQHYLKETYISTDEKGTPTSKNIFVKVAVTKNEKRNYAFASREAMYAFVRNHTDLILQNNVTQVKLNNFFIEENNIIPEGEAIVAYDLYQRYRLVPDKKVSKIAQFVGERFTSYDKNGVATIKPLVFLKRDEKTKLLQPYVLKEAVLPLLTKHQQELGVTDTVLAALKQGRSIKHSSDNMISILELAAFLGKENQFPFAERLKRFISQHVVDKKYLNKKTNQEEYFFSYVHCKNSSVVLMIDKDALAPFLTRYAQGLMQIGISQKNIQKALYTIFENTDFYQFFTERRKRINQKKSLKILQQKRGNDGK